MKLACAGGGTLGPVTPLLAVLEELKRDGDLQVEWFGTASGPERELVTEAGYSFHTLPGGKLRRYLSFQNVTDLGRILTSFVKALAWFSEHKVDALLTAGGFVAVPVGWAAWLMGVPVVVHQQDVRPGLANKLLAPVARRITVAFDSSRAKFPGGKTVTTGNPVRQAFAMKSDQAAARQGLGLAPNLPTVAVLGGGTGAEFLNQLVATALPTLTQFSQVIHLTGVGRGSAPSSSERYLPMPFTLDTWPVLTAADVVVTRAGMGTLTELAALTKAAVVVPLPRSHQEDNAHLLREHGAAVVLEQPALTHEVLLGTVRQLLSDSVARERLGLKLSQLLPAGAASRVAHEVRQLVGRT